MAITVSNWGITQFNMYLSAAYKENYFLNDQSMFTYVYKPGVATWLWRRISARTPSQTADGVLLDGTSATEAKTTVTSASPHLVDEKIPYSDLSQYGGEIPSQISTSLGRDLAVDRQNMLISFIGKTADGRSDNDGIVEFNDESSDDTGESIADAVLGVADRMATANVGKEKIYLVLKPKYFYRLRKVDYIASSLFQSGANNSNLGHIFEWANMQIILGNSSFNVDNSTNSNWDSSFRHDMTGTDSYGAALGVAWVQSALGLFENEKVNGVVFDSKDYQSWKVVARSQFGVTSIYDEGMLVLRGDLDSV